MYIYVYSCVGCNLLFVVRCFFCVVNVCVSVCVVFTFRCCLVCCWCISCMCECVCACVRVCVCVCVCIFACLCVCLCMSVYVCVAVCLFLSVAVAVAVLSAAICLSLHVCMHVHAWRAHMSMRVSAFDCKKMICAHAMDYVHSHLYLNWCIPGGLRNTHAVVKILVILFFFLSYTHILECILHLLHTKMQINQLFRKIEELIDR